MLTNFYEQLRSKTNNASPTIDTQSPTISICGVAAVVLTKSLVVIIICASLSILPALGIASPNNISKKPESNKCSTPILVTITQFKSAFKDGDVTAVCTEDEATVLFKTSQPGISFNIEPGSLGVVDNRTFYGLAAFYNSSILSAIETGGTVTLLGEDPTLLDADRLGAFIGRFAVQVFESPQLSLVVSEDGFGFFWPNVASTSLTLKHIKKINIPDKHPELNRLCYSYLWNWLAGLSKGVEWLINWIHASLISNWGLVIFVFAVIVKVILFPVSWLAERDQQAVSKMQTILVPKLAQIHKEYEGEEVHQRIVAAHKEQGVSLFYALKPMRWFCIQIPVLIALFNALGEMSQFSGVQFLWISDLAYPDSISNIPFVIPLLGSHISLLPFLMTLITVISTLLFRDQHALDSEITKQKRSLYLMAIFFFVLFYPFPAVMVIYWTLSNLLHVIQQQVTR